MYLFNNLWKAAQGAASTLVPESNIPCKTETTGGPMGRTWQAKEASDTQEKDIVTSNMFQPVANAKTESISIVSKRPNGPPCQSITISFFQQKHDQYCTMYIYVYIYSLFLKIEHCNSITLFLTYIYIYVIINISYIQNPRSLHPKSFFLWTAGHRPRWFLPLRLRCWFRTSRSYSLRELKNSLVGL